MIITNQIFGLIMNYPNRESTTMPSTRLTGATRSRAGEVSAVALSCSHKSVLIARKSLEFRRANPLTTAGIFDRSMHQHLLFYALLVVLALSSLVQASPPIDYLIYTSQLAASYPGASNVTPTLPTIESIYAPPSASVLDAHYSTAELRARRDRELAKLADKVLALVRNQSHTHDNNRVDLASTQYAWNLMERQAELYMRNRVHAVKPLIAQLMREAHVSSQCSRAITGWLDQLVELELWPALMWNSWGQFPMAGIFEGAYTDLGSYASCMSIPNNELIGAAQYCMLDFQPLVPARPRFHSIYKQTLGHANGQLNRGDFQPATPGGEQVDARHAAHGFPSKLYADQQAKIELSERHSGKRTADRLSSSSNSAEPVGEQAAQKILSGDNLDITLKARALIELARKAQWLYYFKYRIGACLPSKCSLDDIRKLATTASQRAVLQSSSVSCVKKEPFNVNTYQLIAIYTLAGFAAIAVLGTILDLLGITGDSTASIINWLLLFSMWANTKRLFHLREAGSERQLDCLNGLRFLTTIWVIYGHTVLYSEYQTHNHIHAPIEAQFTYHMPLLLTNFSVGTFFVISGILTTYVTWQYTKGDPRKFNKFAFLISRYIRLTPQLAIVILCFFILPLFGDGPMYRAVADREAAVCYKNWAINLLYLQSYINADEHCIDPAWWLSVEMSFHIVSTLLIIVLINNPRRGMWLCLLVATGFVLAGGVIHYTNGFPIQYLPSIIKHYEVRAELTTLLWHRPYPHAASYFIGFALGYVLANKLVKRLTKWQLALGWSVCALGFAISLMGTHHWNLGAPYTQLEATLYYNLFHILWPVSIAWIILACSLGHGGFVNSILSARFFVPLCRVTYMTYLSHTLIIYYNLARMSAAVEPTMLYYANLTISNAVNAHALGFIMTVVYEMPILNLQKQVLKCFERPSVKELRNSQPPSGTYDSKEKIQELASSKKSK